MTGLTGGAVVVLGALAWIAIVAALARHGQAQLAAKDAALKEMTVQRDYFRTRAERLLDAALVRAGATHQPTMEDRAAAPDRVQGAAAMVTSAMAVTEIDSTRQRQGAR